MRTGKNNATGGNIYHFRGYAMHFCPMAMEFTTSELLFVIVLW
jgi:hypothetical protein